MTAPMLFCLALTRSPELFETLLEELVAWLYVYGPAAYA
jgi:hypothetical protein